MNFNFAGLLALIRQLGPVLPQAWPHVLHIYTDLQAIFALVNKAVPQPAFSTGPGGTTRLGSAPAGLPVDTSQVSQLKSELQKLNMQADDRDLEVLVSGAQAFERLGQAGSAGSQPQASGQASGSAGPQGNP